MICHEGEIMISVRRVASDAIFGQLKGMEQETARREIAEEGEWFVMQFVVNILERWTVIELHVFEAQSEMM